MRSILKSIRQFIIRNLMRIIHCFIGINEKKVVFSSFENQYSCNPRAISEKLHEMEPTADIVWIFSNPETVSEDVPIYVRKVKDSTFKKLKELATARVWVDNCTKEASTWKATDQYYIQTWHGDRGFKKIGYDAGKEPKNFEKAPVFDLAIAGSEYGVRKYRNAFHYQGEVLNVGTPRNDVLMVTDENRAIRTKDKLCIKEKVRILLYAPTFRDNKSGKQQPFEGLDLNETLHVLEQKTREKWICLLRAHHTVHEGFVNQGIGGKCIDVSSFDDIADLMQIADMMISDYSSCAGDFVLTGRPLVLYQGDVQEYEKNSRSFYFNLDKSPYLIARTQEELNSIIRVLTEEKAKENCEEVIKFYGSTETGQASVAVVERIISKIKEKS